MESKKRMQLTVAALVIFAQAAWSLEAWVKYDPFAKSFEVKVGPPDTNDKIAAWGSFHNAINKTGFSFLDLYTNEELPDDHQAYAAGFLEGYLTQDLIRMHYKNMWADYCKDEEAYCERLSSFLQQNMRFMVKNVNMHHLRVPYWHQVYLVLQQMQGLENGRTAQGRHYFPFECDVNVTATLMLRVLKKYRLPYRHTPESDVVIAGHTTTFSSYPGRIFSGDDFYLISSGLATMETTIGNENDDLYRAIKPESVLAFIRNVVANRLAENGHEWTDIFSRYNSGTYNNQWMVLDYNKFTPGEDLQDGLLHVLEQLPAFEFIFNVSGWWRLVEKYGDWFTYDRTPRALMFMRDHHKVVDMDSMMNLMRYNDYKNDPLSRCNCTPPYSAENAISARSDLNPADGVYPFPSLGHRPHGGTDMKLTNSLLFEKLEFVSVSGPTWTQQPPFRWSTSGFKDHHEGHPDLWKFEPFIHHWLLEPHEGLRYEIEQTGNTVMAEEIIFFL
ncbi:hypothetical protein HPB51_006974 [Rhipicephalus microplus]|uniref:Phospholipase B-like n=1 Tax=Rhipicephalus microplus TaxID=6941 RepID=A0A9J6ER92_RHIMP|nr:hypothetical protein HPB51_006974 [Rhipicephalus microplus]